MEGADETLPATPGEARGVHLERGDLVDRYLIIEKVGAGGMGAVYSAFDADLDRRVAIKVLHASEGPSDASSSTQRLLREAQAMARLAHPNVIRVLDVGRHGGEVFVAMEFIDGVTLDVHLTRERPALPRILEIFREAAKGLMAAHEAGLVHRDFKPSNVMVDGRGRVYVMDLGLARLPGKGKPPPLELLDRTSDDATLEDLTRTGALVGTPAYMSPEQYTGHDVDARSDQFSFFVALYEALYGVRPFRGDTPAALAFNVTQGEVRPPPAKSAVPGNLRRVLLRGLNVDPKQRFPDMRAVQEALSPRRRGIHPGFFAAAAAVALAGGIAWARGAAKVDVCAAADASIAEVWSDERRDAVEQAFAATGLEAAPHLAERAVAAIDDRATQWARQSRQACEATHVHGQQSHEVLELRTRCLGVSLAELDALVGVMLEIDAEILQHVPRALSSLTPLETCADVDGLRLGETVATDPTMREQVDEVRVELQRVRMLDEVGRYQRATTALAEVEATAAAIGHRPLSAETAAVRGSLSAHLGDWARAEQDLERAYFTAMGGVHPVVAAQASTSLIKVTGSAYALGRREDALRWARHAEGAARGVPQQPALNAMRLAALGAVLSSTPDRKEEAVENLEAALEQLEAVHGPDHLRVVLTLNDLAYVLMQLEQRERASEALNKALEIENRIVGPDHPFVASTRGLVALQHLHAARFDEAEREMLAAIASLERSSGPDHPNISSNLINLAELYGKTDRQAEMIAPLERAVAIRRKGLGLAHPYYLWTVTYLANTYAQNGRTEDAIGTLELGLRESELEPDHRYVRSAKLALAKQLLAAGREREAVELATAERTRSEQEGASDWTAAYDAVLEQAKAL